MSGDGVAPVSARRPRRVLDAIVLVDKLHGITSNAVLQRVKRAFNADKAGHTGTLDPLATGLLPICFGEATKFSSGLLDADKGYRATIELGATTDTGDREGEVIARGVGQLQAVSSPSPGDGPATAENWQSPESNCRPASCRRPA